MLQDPKAQSSGEAVAADPGGAVQQPSAAVVALGSDNMTDPEVRSASKPEGQGLNAGLCAVLLRPSIDSKENGALDLFIAGRKGEGLGRLWEAIAELACPKNAARALAVASAVVTICKRNPELQSYQPPQKPFEKLLFHLRDNQSEVLALVEQSGSGRLSTFLGDDRVLGLCRGRVLEDFIRRAASDLAEKGADPGYLTEVVYALVRRPKPRSVAMLQFIQKGCDDVCSGGTQKSRDFFWKLRDELTGKLMRNRHVAESNLKLRELFARDVPHPRAGSEPSMIATNALCRLSKIGVAVSETGAVSFTRNPPHIGQQWCTSAVFIGPTQLNTIDFPPAGAVQDFQAQVIAPLKKRCGLDFENQGSSHAPQQRYPRTWVDEADGIRYQAARLQEALAGLSSYVSYRKLSPADEGLIKGFFAQIVREQPHALAEVKSQMKALPPFLSGLFVQALSGEIKRLAEIEKCEAASTVSSDVRAALCVGYWYGVSIRELARPALRELEAVLKNATAADLEKHDTVALVGVVSRLTRLSEPLEKRAIELIKSYPDTLGSAVLSLLLHELRVSDDEVQRLVLAQAQRNDLPTDVWLNYSLCAFGVGFTEQGRCKARELYHQFYSPRITATPENSQRTRAWNRLTTGALFPEKLGGIRTSKRHFFGPSNFESRVVRTLRDDDELYLRDDVRIPGAPTIKAVINPDGVGKGCVVLTDSEWFTAAADEAWVKRGYKGHVHIVNKMLTEAGWHVLRIPETFAPESKQPQLCAALQQLKEYFSSQRSPTCGPLIIDPPDCFTEIANHIMLYTAKKPDSA